MSVCFYHTLCYLALMCSAKGYIHRVHSHSSIVVHMQTWTTTQTFSSMLVTLLSCVYVHILPPRQ